MKKRLAGVLAAVAILSAATAGIEGAYAYFTTNAEAAGSQTVSLGDQTTIHEEYTGWEKRVVIENLSTSSQAVYVRVRAFAGVEYTLDSSGSGNRWSDGGDGYWYYADPVVPGGTTGTTADNGGYFSVKISGLNTNEAVDPRTFNVVVVYETTPAVQDGTNEDGSVRYVPQDASTWTRTVAEGGDAS